MENIITQLIAASAGSVGFALLFNVHKKHLLPAAVSGLLSWGIFLLCDRVFCLEVLVSTITAAAFCQFFSEIMARIYKAPTTVFVIPAVVPLIPGGSLYNTMYAAVMKDWALFRAYGAQTLLGTLGIAIGLSFVSGVLYVAVNRAKQNASK